VLKVIYLIKFLQSKLCVYYLFLRHGPISNFLLWLSNSNNKITRERILWNNSKLGENIVEMSLLSSCPNTRGQHELPYCDHALTSEGTWTSSLVTIPYNARGNKLVPLSLCHIMWGDMSWYPCHNATPCEGTWAGSLVIIPHREGGHELVPLSSWHTMWGDMSWFPCHHATPWEGTWASSLVIMPHHKRGHELVPLSSWHTMLGDMSWFHYHHATPWEGTWVGSIVIMPHQVSGDETGRNVKQTNLFHMLPKYRPFHYSNSLHIMMLGQTGNLTFFRSLGAVIRTRQQLLRPVHK
jgi:hypothetical protein